MFTIGQILCHMVGDFCLQSHGMARVKGKDFKVACYHAIFYSLPFLLFLGPSVLSAFLIISTHAIIDRYRLPKLITVIKNYAAIFNIGCPRPSLPPDDITGYPPDVDKHLALVLYIVCDALMHILLNGVILHYFH